MTATVERLEPRRLLSASTPTNLEQYMVELINRARADPAAEAARFGIDLNEGLPADAISADAKQPLAIDPDLIDSARAHSQDMLDHQYFAHDGSDGSDPADRISKAGYVFSGFWGWGENIVYRSQRPTVPAAVPTILQEHQDLFVDTGIADRGHRLNLENPAFREVGVGVFAGQFQGYNALMTTQDFAYTGGNSFLTGVAYADKVVHDHFYTPGEGIGGLSITAVRQADDAAFSTITWPTGGYSLRLPPGTYTVTASGAGLANSIIYDNVTIDSQNSKRDFRPDAPPASPGVPASVSVPAGAGSIRGKLFNDLNGNSRFDPHEPLLSGWQVFLDINRSGSADPGEPALTSAINGRYTFTGLAAGTYSVAVSLPAGWRATTSDISVIVRKRAARAAPIGMTQAAMLSGTIFVDVNGDGAPQPIERGLSHARLFADLNADGVRQAKEPMVRANAAGRWSFNGLSVGAYAVRVLPLANYHPTAPADGILEISLSPAEVSMDHPIAEQRFISHG